jgi:asparagine synthase (glutamine-hydrolysing)
MCGICGSANTLGSSPKNLDESVRLLVNRGPDDHGIYMDNQVSLGHTRLAIQDCANAQQPMISFSGLHVIVFNGEIYNHFNLRTLVPDHNWKTRSDTETVLELFELFGQEIFNKFVGMYAFGIWSKELNQLTLARDVKGEKPLFYSVSDEGITFASEAKVVASILEIDQKVNSNTFPYFLKYGYLNPKESFINEVIPVLPGEVISWAAGKRLIDLENSKKKVKDDYFEKAESVSKLIEKAVHRTLLADDRVGIMLSGGIDSSIIAALASEACQGLPTFTFVLNKNSLDAKYARLVARKIKSEHYEVTLDQSEIAEEIERVITKLPQPVADSAVIPTNLLSEFARTKVKVLLSGDGADEIFAGYGYYEKYKNLNKTSKIESYAREGIFNLLKKSRYKKINILRDEFRRSKITSERTSYQESWNEDLAAFTDSELGKMLGIKNFEEPKGLLNYNGSKPGFWDVLSADREYYLTGNILRKSDLGGMLASVEIRAPYLDRDLNRYLMENISDPNLLSKKILYDSFPNLIPKVVYERKKQGFGAPLDEWFANESVSKLVNSVLMNQKSIIYKHFDFEKSARYIKKSNLKKWNFFVLALWLKNNGSR